ncbi:MAG: sigma-70 family RNA polymerase sigma factor [Bacteroidetes bacterium]|nr:sigma-70 family RNA polymerase sigma factor [Bacteroidota bacterium]
MSEKEILQLCRDVSTRNDGFDQLVRTYQRPIYWHIRRLVIDHDDTNDLVQNVFIKVWKHLEEFREDSRLFTWMYSIATNEALSLLKYRRMRVFLPLHDVENELTQSLHADNYFNGDEIQIKLQKAILRLPPKQRIVFNMKYFDNLTYDDMSEILKTSVGALKASYHHAVRKIEDFLLNH